MNDEIKSKIINSFEREKTKLDANDFERVVSMLQEAKHADEEETEEESDFSKLGVTPVDAFVAVGGNPDTSGTVLKRTIEEAILSFDLKIDIQEFLDQISSNELTYEDFKSLFQKMPDDNKSSISVKSVTYH